MTESTPTGRPRATDDLNEDEAARRRRADELRAEAEALAADSADRADAAAVLKDMESLRAW
ncbi:hypothetical protein [Actinomadura sp. 7K507]|uniref:hypothetical protein n=1 Tax=Actinomadura sp. 7K507 TaxID=2530365 RepID=UPI001046E802|nr:hypothetical protein [Actinomadura sp. 7K507]TDC96128.1 hypothetical protein E1285_05960 [Actinomadura sp. 7K507]